MRMRSYEILGEWKEDPDKERVVSEEKHVIDGNDDKLIRVKEQARTDDELSVEPV